MVVVVTGVAGSGKTTVGRVLAARLAVAFVDADDLHTPASIGAMRGGTPLDEAARAVWLDRVAAVADASRPVVVACSGLRRAHRDRLRAALDDVRFVVLDVPPVVLARRLGRRTDHFFPPALLADQLATFEPPGPDEPVLRVDGTRPVGEVAEEIAAALRPPGAAPEP